MTKLLSEKDLEKYGFSWKIINEFKTEEIKLLLDSKEPKSPSLAAMSLTNFFTEINNAVEKTRFASFDEHILKEQPIIDLIKSHLKNLEIFSDEIIDIIYRYLHYIVDYKNKMTYHREEYIDKQEEIQLISDLHLISNPKIALITKSIENGILLKEFKDKNGISYFESLQTRIITIINASVESNKINGEDEENLTLYNNNIKDHPIFKNSKITFNDPHYHIILKLITSNASDRKNLLEHLKINIFKKDHDKEGFDISFIAPDFVKKSVEQLEDFLLKKLSIDIDTSKNNFSNYKYDSLLDNILKLLFNNTPDDITRITTLLQTDGFAKILFFTDKDSLTSIIAFKITKLAILFAAQSCKTTQADNQFISEIKKTENLDSAINIFYMKINQNSLTEFDVKSLNYLYFSAIKNYFFNKTMVVAKDVTPKTDTLIENFIIPKVFYESILNTFNEACIEYKNKNASKIFKLKGMERLEEIQKKLQRIYLSHKSAKGKIVDLGYILADVILEQHKSVVNDSSFRSILLKKLYSNKFSEKYFFNSNTIEEDPSYNRLKSNLKPEYFIPAVKRLGFEEEERSRFYSKETYQQQADALIAAINIDLSLFLKHKTKECKDLAEVSKKEYVTAFTTLFVVTNAIKNLLSSTNPQNNLAKILLLNELSKHQASLILVFTDECIQLKNEQKSLYNPDEQTQTDILFILANYTRDDFKLQPPAVRDLISSPYN